MFALQSGDLEGRHEKAPKFLQPRACEESLLKLEDHRLEHHRDELDAE